MHVVLVQTASELEPEANRVRLDALTPHTDADLVVFPEAFARDFGQPGMPLAPFAEPLDGPFATEVARVAADRGSTLVAGMFEPSADPERPFNTLVVRGRVDTAYRKIHLYDSFGYRESDRLAQAAIEPVTFPLADFTVGLLTCYDLRFPELARVLVERDADVLVVPAAWVAGPHKVDHWLTLARARAIENTAYVVAAGQSGPRYSGHSVVVDPFGRILVQAEAEDAVLHAHLDPVVVREARDANPSLANRRM